MKTHFKIDLNKIFGIRKVEDKYDFKKRLIVNNDLGDMFLKKLDKLSIEDLIFLKVILSVEKTKMTFIPIFLINSLDKIMNNVIIKYLLTVVGDLGEVENLGVSKEMIDKFLEQQGIHDNENDILYL